MDGVGGFREWAAIDRIYPKENRVETVNKRIMVGIESFEKLIDGDYYYIDKTPFIKELLDSRGDVTLITRPRRFGKTLNMSMLKSFLDIGKDSRGLFDGLNIMEHADICDKYLNKYPVISMSLKNIELSTFRDSVDRLKILVSSVYRQYLYLCESAMLDEYQKRKFHRYCSEEATEAELHAALIFLTECLYSYYGIRAIVLLDEYDTPIDASVRWGYYDEMIRFMRGFLGSVFKTNEYLAFGLLTGVQRISGESLFSSFNNPKICGIADAEFATCFGFTEEEVKAACEAFGAGDKFDEVRMWYDGYRFGGKDMYNPWSITRYLERRKIENYWVNTGSVHILQDIFYDGDNNLRNDFAKLLTGTPITMSIEDGITYPIKFVNTDTFWTLLLNAGYLKPCNGAKVDRFGAELVNMEVKDTLSRYAKKWLREQRPSMSETILEFVEYLLKGNTNGVSTVLNDKLLNSPSSHDLIAENSYHMFIYGMLLALSGKYLVFSNHESGKGRSDCAIKPIDNSGSAVVVEFKHVKTLPLAGLAKEAQEALEQIEEKAYVNDLKREGYGHILKYGIAFHKKSCEVAMVSEIVE